MTTCLEADKPFSHIPWRWRREDQEFKASWATWASTDKQTQFQKNQQLPPSIGNNCQVVCGFGLELTKVSRKRRKNRHTDDMPRKAGITWVMLTLMEPHQVFNSKQYPRHFYHIQHRGKGWALLLCSVGICGRADSGYRHPGARSCIHLSIIRKPLYRLSTVILGPEESFATPVSLIPGKTVALPGSEALGFMSQLCSCQTIHIQVLHVHPGLPLLLTKIYIREE